MEEKAVIFDYNRTVFDPETGNLIEGISELLKQLKNEVWKLFLISKGSEERRQQIKELDLYEIFDYVIVAEEKTKADFEECLAQCEPGTAFSVIGDIAKGN